MQRIHVLFILAAACSSEVSEGPPMGPSEGRPASPRRCRASWPTGFPLGLIALAVMVAACDRFYSVRGNVTSCATRAPLAGASVDLSYPGEHGASQTKPDGNFSVAVNDPPNDRAATLVVKAPQHQPASLAVHDKQHVDVCLEEAPPAAGPAPPP